MRARAMRVRTSSPNRAARPAWGAMKPSSTSMVVVFPEPLGPRNPNTSPRSTRRLMPRNASTVLPRSRKRTEMSRASIAMLIAVSFLG